MNDKTNFSRRLKQFDGLTWLTLTPVCYDRSTLLLWRHIAKPAAWSLVLTYGFDQFRQCACRRKYFPFVCGRFKLCIL